MLCRKEQAAIQLGNRYTAPPSRDFLPEANTGWPHVKDWVTEEVK